GTRTHSEVATVTDLDRWSDAPIASTVFRTTGSRSAATTGVQLRRNCRRRQSPVARRAIARPTPTAQARKTKSAQRPGMAIAGARLRDTGADIPDVIIIACRWPGPAPKPPGTGSAATVSNARNQTANRVPE